MPHGPGDADASSDPPVVALPTPTPLAAVELHLVELDLVAPLRSAHGEERRRSVVLVRALDADGAEGWGECSALARPTYTHEDVEGAWRILHDELVPAALAGVEPEVRTWPMAAAALEVARLDLALRRSGRSLREAVGGVHRPLPVAAVVGRVDSTAELLATVEERVAGGAALVKLKLAPDDGLGGLTAVRDRWPDLPLAADANGSLAPWHHDDLVRERLEALDLAYLEQPLPGDRLVGSAGWAAASRTPVALDESVAGPGAAEAALALGAGSVLNVKPARVGGIRAAVEVVAVARAAGVGWFVGGMLETGVGRAAALAVACLPGPAFPTDLGPSARYVADDLTEPLVADASGRVVPPGGPGIGVAPRPERLAECTRRRAVLRAGGGAGPGR